MARYVSGSTNEYLHFVALSTSDHVTRVTGLTSFNVYAAATSASTGSTYGLSVNEVNSTQMPGVYRVLLADSSLMSIPAGVDSREICIHISSSMDPVTRTFDLYRRAVTTGQTLALNSSGKIADVESILSKLTSVETDVDSVLTKVTSIDTNTTALIVLATSINSHVNAVQAQTTQLAFTQSGKVDANVHYINNVQVQGAGTTANTWRPV
jgi:hypothetical protein